MRRSLSLLVLLVIAAPLAGGLAGCSGHQLDTGYVYTPLGTSTDKRRGYYADPFSPEARVAQAERTNPVDVPRPIPSK